MLKSEKDVHEDLLMTIRHPGVKAKCAVLLQLGAEVRQAQQERELSLAQVTRDFQDQFSILTTRWTADAAALSSEICQQQEEEEIDDLMKVAEQAKLLLRRRAGEVDMYSSDAAQDMLSCHPATHQLEKAIDAFKRARVDVEMLCEHIRSSEASMGEITIPFQVLFSDVTFFDEATQAFDVRMEVGDVCNSQGKSLMSELCSICGYTIQKGAWQEGQLRYRCIDCPNRVFCAPCYEACRQWKTCVPSCRGGTRRLIQLLHDANPCLQHYVAREYNLVTFAAIEASKEPNLRRKMQRRFERLYPDRPCFSLPLLNPLDTAEPVRYLSFHDVWQLVQCLGWELHRYWTATTSTSTSMKKEVLALPQGRTVAIVTSQSPTAYVAAFAAVSLQAQFSILEPTWPVSDILTCCRLLHGNSTAASEEDPRGRFVLLLDDVMACVLAEHVDKLKRAGDVKLLEDVQQILAAAIRFEVQDYPTATRHVEKEAEEEVNLLPSLLEVVFPQRFTLPFAQSILQPSQELLEDEAQLDGEVMSDGELPVCVIFSSGSGGGSPKGVVMRVAMLYKEISIPFYDLPIVSVSKASPAWATDQRVVIHTAFFGGRIGFVPRQNSPFIIFDFLTRFQPTMFLSLVPAQAEILCSIFQQRVRSAKEKWATLRGAQADNDDVSIEAKAIAEAVETCYRMLGNRARSIGISGAAVKSDLLEQLRLILPCEVSETYGITECGGIGSAGESASGGIGIRPGKDIEWTLRDVEGFTAADKPFPRGELWLRSEFNVSLGDYICDEPSMEQMRRRYDDAGFVNTGDIAVKYPDGTLDIVGRSSSLVKLPNGQFMSPEQVEKAIGIVSSCRSTFVDVVDGCVRLFLEVSTREDMLIDAAAVAQKALEEARQRCLTLQIPAACIPTAVYLDVQPTPRSSWVSRGFCTSTLKLSRPKLRRYFSEVVSSRAPDFHHLTEEEGGLKGKRNGAVVPETLGSQCTALEVKAIDLLIAAGSVLPPSILTSDRPLESLAAYLRTPMHALGVDSIRLSKLMASINRKLLVAALSRRSATNAVPPLAIDNLSPMDIVEALDGCSNTSSSSLPPRTADSYLLAPPSSHNNHPKSDKAPNDEKGCDSTDQVIPVSRRRDLCDEVLEVLGFQPSDLSDVGKLAAFLAKFEEAVKRQVHDSVVTAASAAKKMPLVDETTCSSSSATDVVLLVTGAAGFLGSFVAAQLLQSSWVSKIYCIVRAASKEDASERIKAVLSKVLQRPLGDVDDEKVVVFQGDCTLERFGLCPEDYSLLQRDLTGIVHVAAAVKSWTVARGLPALLRENATACLRVAQLALTCRRSSVTISYTSTLSVDPAIGALEQHETTSSSSSYRNFSIASESPQVLASLSAYAISKAMGEIILREAVWKGEEEQLFGVSSTNSLTLDIFRPCLLTPSRGVRNSDDWLCRFIDTVRQLQLAPILCHEATSYNPTEDKEETKVNDSHGNSFSSAEVRFDRETIYCPVEDCSYGIVQELYKRCVLTLVEEGKKKKKVELILTPRANMARPLPHFRISHILNQLHSSHPNIHFVPLYAFARACLLLVPPPPFYPLVYEHLGKEKSEQLQDTLIAETRRMSYNGCSAPEL